MSQLRFLLAIGIILCTPYEAVAGGGEVPPSAPLHAPDCKCAERIAIAIEGAAAPREPDPEERRMAALDLKAQQGMDAAAQLMARLTRQQVALGWAATVGLIATLLLNAVALFLSRSALQLSRKATIAELRPYLSYKSFDAVISDKEIRWIINVKNFGSSVARNICWDGTSISIDGKLNKLQMPEVTEWLYTEEIVPGDDQSFGFSVDKPAIIDKILNGDARFVVKVHIKYDDLFGTTHDYIINEMRWGPNLKSALFNQCDAVRSEVRGSGRAGWRGLMEWRRRREALQS